MERYILRDEGICSGLKHDFFDGVGDETYAFYRLHANFTIMTIHVDCDGIKIKIFPFPLQLSHTSFALFKIGEVPATCTWKDDECV